MNYFRIIGNGLMGGFSTAGGSSVLLGARGYTADIKY